MSAADASLKCEMCDVLGIAGPCRTHKADPFAGVIDDTCTDCREPVGRCECYVSEYEI